MNHIGKRERKTRSIAAPYWFLFFLTGSLSASRVFSYLRRRRHQRLGRCPNCSYDLRATPDRCPECGTIPAKANG